MNRTNIKNLFLVLSLVPVTLCMWGIVAQSLGVESLNKIIVYGVIGIGLLIPGLFIKER